MDSIFNTDIESDTLNNTYFRKVLFTTEHQQLVVMNLKPSEHIPKEIHATNDQFIRIEKGNAVAIINDNNKVSLKDGSVLIIPANTYHEIINISDKEPLKLYTIYSPPKHPPNKIDVEQPKESSQEGGGYMKKYYKYKQKYLNLRNNTNLDDYFKN